METLNSYCCIVTGLDVLLFEHGTPCTCTTEFVVGVCCGVVSGRGMWGKHGRGDGGSAECGAAKRRKGPAGQKLRHAALAAAAATAIPNKHMAVGCRVGVYWRLDKAFYTVRRRRGRAQAGAVLPAGSSMSVCAGQPT